MPRKELQLPEATVSNIIWDYFQMWSFPPDQSLRIYSSQWLSWHGNLVFDWGGSQQNNDVTHNGETEHLRHFQPCSFQQPDTLLRAEEGRTSCHCSSAVTTHLTLRPQSITINSHWGITPVYFDSGAFKCRSRLHKDRFWLWFSSE